MGKIIKIERPGELIPTQEYFFNQRVEEIFEKYEKDKKRLIVILKESPVGRLIVDGHHSSIIGYASQVIEEPIDIYAFFPKNENDLIVQLPKEFYQDSNLINLINKNIESRFSNLEKEIYGCAPTIKSMWENKMRMMENNGNY